jgi:hypothetical protein
MREVTNFWEVISEYAIEIPIIQRDYAQGRKTPKVNEIRKKILDDIFLALNESHRLEFDFVYGNIEIRDAGCIFIPLDGQQRLTTLFLLHWYLAFVEKRFTEIKILRRFTYETRTSSRDFCHALVENANEIPDLINGSSISSIIRNESWFFLSWIKDPTIKAMLQTLDDIHCKFFNTNLWDVISDVNDCPIVFRFIKLEEFGLGDDLYIKMNARGKALTDFENFKAKFEQHLSQKFSNELSYFSNKIDGSWTDLFWSPPENARFDDKYLNFFKAVAFNNYALKIDTSVIKKLEQIGNKISTIPSLLIQIDIEALRDLKVLDVLPQIMNSNDLEFEKINIHNLFMQIIESSNPTYFQRLMFYAISRFLTKSQNSVINMQKFSVWIRVIYNLVRNSEFDEVIEFARSVKSIDDLIKYADEILEYISKSDNAIQGFNLTQIEEERLKASLILRSKEWKSIIYEAENHKYYDGQIGFILNFSGIEYNKISEWSNTEEEKFLERFIEYFKKSCAIFGNEGLKIPFYLWERALLCKGYYWIGRGDRVSLLLNTHRDYSWKRLLRDTDNSEKRGFAKQVLDCIEVETVIQDLNTIINNHTLTDIRKYFIDDPRIIEACNGRFIQKHNDTYLLLKTSITAGYHKELRSYSLYLRLKKICGCDKKCTCTVYLEQCGINNVKKIIKVNNHFVDISFENGYFCIIYNDKQQKFQQEDEVLMYLSAQGIIN